MAGGGRTKRSPTRPLGVTYCEKCFGLVYIVHRINQLAREQVKRRSIVEHEVVKRIGQDFRQPDQAGLDVPDEEELHGAEQQSSKADNQPDLADVLDEDGAIGVRRKNPE